MRLNKLYVYLRQFSSESFPIVSGSVLRLRFSIERRDRKRNLLKVNVLSLPSNRNTQPQQLQKTYWKKRERKPNHQTDLFIFRAYGIEQIISNWEKTRNKSVIKRTNRSVSIVSISDSIETKAKKEIFELVWRMERKKSKKLPQFRVRVSEHTQRHCFRRKLLCWLCNTSRIMNIALNEKE